MTENCFIKQNQTVFVETYFKSDFRNSNLAFSQYQVEEKIRCFSSLTNEKQYSSSIWFQLVQQENRVHLNTSCRGDSCHLPWSFT